MNISIEWHGEQFNVGIASKEGREPFISIKGARIATGSKGEFVSWPATKNASGKWWNHVWGSDDFNAVVLAKAKESRPTSAPQKQARRQEDDSDPIPF